MSASLLPADVRRLRLRSLLLHEVAERSALEVATWFGAMQAQDLPSGQWSLGTRMGDVGLDDVEAAFVAGEVVRTWPMRGTIHVVPAVDARWMLELTGVRALAGAARRREHLGLTDEIVARACDVLAASLAGGRSLTRSACVQLLIDAGLHTATEHGYHLLWYASQVGITCMGPQVDGEQSFVLLDEWVPAPRQLDREEALAELARRFVRSHGPVPRKDLAGWTGLPLRDVDAGLAALGDEVATVEVDGAPMLVTAEALDAVSSVEDRPLVVRLLLGFDELVLGYKDRSLIVDDAHRDRIVPGNNGMFRPTVVVDGRVVGTWKRTITKAKVPKAKVAVEPFGRLGAGVRAAVEAEAARYAAFQGLEPAVTWP